MSLDATLAAIDELAVQQCGHCNAPLADDGQSPDFCGPDCQQAWTETRNEIVELIGYREPYDLPVHQARLVEFTSPEVTPGYSGFTNVSLAELLPANGVSVEDFPASFAEVAARIDQTMLGFDRVVIVNRDVYEARGIIERFSSPPPPSDHASGRALDVSLVYRAHVRQRISIAFDVPEHLLDGSVSIGYSLGEAQPEPVGDGPFDPDHEYEWRPVPSLSGESIELPVMAAVERDWQALVDAAFHRRLSPPPPVSPRLLIQNLGSGA